MRIRRLPETTVNRIAAGEVIERPSSVVKELVENSIDAGAANIEVIFRDGGRTLIRVSDDGFGMSRQDLPLALERHATSKLPGDDLVHVGTLGFRGEALPSIAAVARLVITARERGASSAWALTVEAGMAAEPRPAALACGTVVEVRDLFFAVPARLKFLRSERAETADALDVLRRLAVAHPSIGFTFTTADRRLLGLAAPSSGGDPLSSRLAEVAGKDFLESAIPFATSSHAYSIRGLAGLPTHHRAQPNMQFMVVNGRPVRDRLLMSAIRGAYADVLPRGRFPAVALIVECLPELVDVNVHPAKTEVRFRDAALLRSLIVGSIRNAIAAARAPAVPLSALALSAHAPSAAQPTMAFDSRSPVAYGGFAEDAVPPPDPSPPQPVLGHARGQIHDTYIVSETEDGVVIVDQHAAHERIVYEKMKRELASSCIASQPLLVPAVVDLDPVSVARIESQADVLSRLGLHVEAFGRDCVILRELPAPLAGANISALLHDIADELETIPADESLQDKINRLLASMACHHSVRAGRKLKVDEMNALLREMETTLNAGQCNHGRPTHVELKLADIERLFGRR